MEAPLRYTAASEFNPGDPFGMTDLTIGEDGAATLDVHHRGTVRSWAGTVGRATVDTIEAAMAEAGFPAVEPQQPPPAGAPLRVLRRGEGDGTEVAGIAYHTARKAGYREAFALLDALVVALTEGEVPVVLSPPPVEVSGVRRTDATA